jgi:hypothetical protein
MNTHFAAPLVWVNTQTGEKNVLYNAPPADSSRGPIDLLISTADNFILITALQVSDHIEFLGTIVADLNTGEIVLRTGAQSSAVGWAACPAK